MSTDQLLALVEVARSGSLRAAADALFITEQGVRNRLIALETELGTELYRKARGIRRGEILTAAGRLLLPEAQRMLEQASGLRELVHQQTATRDVHVASSQYLSTYVLIDAIQRFHQAEPHIRVWLSVRTERDIEAALISNPELAFGFAAPYEPSIDLVYKHLFSMTWSLITPRRHALLRKQRVSLSDLHEYPLILFERGSTGRQHVLEAFLRQGVTPRIEMESTTTDLIVRMVAAGLGVAIIPLLPSGVVTRDQKVVVRELVDEIRPIDSGTLTRRNEPLTQAAQSFLRFVQREAVVINGD
ncbi:MAG TPA: LysR family transcriptional regulator [Pirellulales bacterium]|nr:LysR family transcriptional regulator [Pirellulales bacterium]